jgi:2,4-dienoyl-CoA reductase-like NADH-dependent reductase (Old Yellow Enzyme family)
VRIVAEIVDQIKTSVEPDFTVFIKTNCNDRQGVEGISADNFPYLAQELEKTGIDAIEISGAMPARTNIDAPEKQSYFARYTENLDLSIPVILTGGNISIDVIERICQREKVDFFGFARPLIAESDLPNRWLKMAGDTECECISCNQCLSYLFTGQNLVTCQVL